MGTRFVERGVLPSSFFGPRKRKEADMKQSVWVAIIGVATAGFATAAMGVPTCKELPATIYVDSNNNIVGGPDNGTAYTGTLNGTAGDDVMVGTAGPDTTNAMEGND